MKAILENVEDFPAGTIFKYEIAGSSRVVVALGDHSYLRPNGSIVVGTASTTAMYTIVLGIYAGQVLE